MLFPKVVCGKVVGRPSTMSQELAEDLLRTQTDHSFDTILGTTMCTDDFYEGTLYMYICNWHMLSLYIIHAYTASGVHHIGFDMIRVISYFARTSKN